MKWNPIEPESLHPRVLLAGFYVRFPPYRGTSWQPGLGLTLVTKGRMRYVSPEGRKCVAEPGDLICYYPGPIRYEILGEEAMWYYQLSFQPARESVYDGVPFVPGNGFIPNRTATGSDCHQFASIFDKILQALHEMSPTWQMMTTAAALELIALTFSRTRNRVPKPAKGGDIWGKLVSQLERQTEIPVVSELARECHLSTEHFIREFKRRVGCSPKQYVLQCRLWKAHGLLKTGMSVKETAVRCGFKDPLYFSRLYRRLHGHPPSRAVSSSSAIAPDSHPGLPLDRHLLAPGVDLKIFRDKSS